MFNAKSSSFFILKHSERGAVSKTTLVTLPIFFGVMAMVWAVLPSSFSTDLEQIGQGKPAIAIVYDMEDGAAISLMEGYGTIRHEYEHLVLFLVVDSSSPKGQKFIRENQVTTGSALYYAATGEKIAILHGPQETDYLINSIKNIFDL